MKDKMKNYKFLSLLLLLLTLAVSSCDEYEDGIVDRLARSEWETDLGKNASINGEPLFSVFTFNYDGTGIEYLYFSTDEELYLKEYFRWRLLQTNYDDAIELSYRDGSQFLDKIRFKSDRMEAVWFRNKRDFDNPGQGRGTFIVLDEVYPRELFD